MSMAENQSIISQMEYFIIVHAFLLVYLLIPWLERQLKQYYLPIILVFYSVALVVGSVIYLYVPDRTIVDFITNSYGLVPILIVPLVFIAWQYDRKHVLIYTAFTNVSDIAIAVVIAQGISLENLPILSMPIIRGFAFMMVGLVVNQLSDSSRKQKHRLLLANVQLSQYSNTLEHLATSRERNRLARELHDTTAHTLSGISVNLEALKTIAPEDNPEMQGMISTTLEAARNGLSDTRRALKDLRAQPLEDLGLELALRQLIDSVAERAGLKTNVNIDTPLPYLAPNIEQVFYRIAQESLENTARHANAYMVTVELHEEDGKLTMLIQDDGRGFNMNEVHGEGHFGLKGMHERALTIGAELTIESQLGGGTNVQLSWERF
ncbi:MAG TPA: sensor histidine kinase, partial [Anaerolineaceae bacterium]|nr:sensor histidine kinase [Anaerolineaceae bacterium]